MLRRWRRSLLASRDEVAAHGGDEAVDGGEPGAALTKAWKAMPPGSCTMMAVAVVEAAWPARNCRTVCASGKFATWMMLCGDCGGGGAVGAEPGAGAAAGRISGSREADVEVVLSAAAPAG